MSAVDAVRSLPTEEKQGLALFATHGVADAATTVVAAHVLTISHEGNPLLVPLLAQGYGFAAAAMLLVVGAISLTYPTLAKAAEFPPWFGYGLSAVGLALAALNLVEVVGVL